MIRRLNIDGVQVQLEDLGNHQGTIIISGYGNDCSTYWGAMGCNIEEFILNINGDYFANRLCHKNYVFSSKKTFVNVREYLRNEVYELNGWYKHLEFQKDMRERLNEFQERCHSEESFVNGWRSFIDGLNYNLIDKYDRDSVRNELEGINEVWHFIGQAPSQEFLNLEKLLIKIKRDLKSGKGELFQKINV